MEFESKPLTAWDNLEDVRRLNPVGRVPALVLDDGEVLFDSSAILEYLDEIAGPETALVPPHGHARREVLRLTAAALGVMEKEAAVRFELNQRPSEKVHQPWIEHNRGQVHSGLEWLNSQVKGPWMTGERLTQADVTTVVTCDFLRAFDESLLPSGKYPALDGLIERATSMIPFAVTHPAVH
jgi:glutathione S-transferase